VPFHNFPESSEIPEIGHWKVFLESLSIITFHPVFYHHPDYKDPFVSGYLTFSILAMVNWEIPSHQDLGYTALGNPLLRVSQPLEKGLGDTCLPCLALPVCRYYLIIQF